MKITLRITLLFTSLLLFMSSAKGIVIEKESAKKVIISNNQSLGNKAKQFINKRIIKKFKKQARNIQNRWSKLKKEKKKFGKIGSISLFVLIATVGFTVLKLTGVITWSWFWVLSPLIIYIGLILLAAIIALFAVLALKNANE